MDKTVARPQNSTTDNGEQLPCSRQVPAQLMAPTATVASPPREAVSLELVAPAATKRRKKKKPKKPAMNSGGTPNAAPVKHQNTSVAGGERPSPLCISRNKHWKYISSYHVG